MDIIINPTFRCNFKCEFCAASNLPQKRLSYEDTIKILKPYIEQGKLGQIIINGGDPLMIEPSYYLELLNYLDKYSPFTTISLTTNLWDFYNNPDKWDEVFRNKRIGIITSFQYGTKRRINKDIIFTDMIFLDVIEEFRKRNYGYIPNFISVIDKDNEKYYKDTIELAKQLKVKCKLNKAVIAGKETNYYPRYRLFEILLKVFENNLQDYEMNCSLLMNYFTGKNVYCPLGNKSCFESIRAINPDGSIYRCGFLANTNEKDYDQFRKKYNVIMDKCYICDNFLLCNSCYSYIKEIKNNNDESNYCKNMKSIIPKLKEYCIKNV